MQKSEAGWFFPPDTCWCFLGICTVFLLWFTSKNNNTWLLCLPIVKLNGSWVTELLSSAKISSLLHVSLHFWGQRKWRSEDAGVLLPRQKTQTPSGCYRACSLCVPAESWCAKIWSLSCCDYAARRLRQRLSFKVWRSPAASGCKTRILSRQRERERERVTHVC